MPTLPSTPNARNSPAGRSNANNIVDYHDYLDDNKAGADDSNYDKCDPTTGTPIHGNDIIGDLLRNNMTLLTFAIDPFGRLGLIARSFLFWDITTHATFPTSLTTQRN
jgi:hypothetical protein